MGKTESKHPGRASLANGEQPPKTAPVFEALGALDEASAAIGLARAAATDDDRRATLLESQHILYACGAEISTMSERATDVDFAKSTKRLDALTLRYSERFGTPDGFVTAGETAAEAALNNARAVVRRAERRILAVEDPRIALVGEIAECVNRMSGLLFVLAWAERKRAGR
jgi:cob(I)alamin adenosyltransferase